MVGLLTAKTIALVHGLPLVAVNHLEAHALTARLVQDVGFPYLLLLVSGGHCQLVAVEGVGRYRQLGTTVDDALGEAFDKVAKMLGLGYPGGPAVEKLARSGDPRRFSFPRPLLGSKSCDFSFSGLKTAVRHEILALGAEAAVRQTMADLCAGFQAAVGDVLVDRTVRALRRFRSEHPVCHALVLAGGVAANQQLRARLEETAMGHGLPLIAPPLELCTDNAIMVAWAGVERLRLGPVDDQAQPARARWPLEELAAPGAG
jgi:N6-L-threonylcarbamoyladenine synthase